MSQELRTETKRLDFHRACVKLAAGVAIASATAKFILHELEWLLLLLGIHFN
jgi:hypothetical protein